MGRLRGGVEARQESAIELGVVLAQAVLGVSIGGVDGVDLDQRGRQEHLYLAHGAEEAVALRLAQRFEEGPSQGLAPTVEHCSFGATLPGEAGGSDAMVAGTGADGDEGIGLE